MYVSPYILSFHPFDVTLIVERDVGPDPLESILSLKGLFTMLKPSLPTLMDIKIEYYDIDDNETSDGLFADLLLGLKKMAGQNVVKTIELTWPHSDWHDCMRWVELDDVLMGSPKDWPALREVSLSLSFDEPEDVNTDMAVRRLLSMTRLEKSKRVKFDFNIL